MIWALDEQGKHVFADHGFVKTPYFCPICGEKLVLKKGEVRIPHFAHPPHSSCSDSWHYDMSDWHREWQERFPRESQEVVMTANGEKHRADVFVKNIVIEFQHSPLSCDEFEERNAFYIGLGYKVIWLFDLTEIFHDDSIEESHKKANVFKWRRPKSTFNDFDYRNKNVELYFQTEDYVGEDGPVAAICKVTWVSPEGFEHFALDGAYIDHDDFVDIFLPRPKKLTPKNLNLPLIEVGHKDHTTFYKCPIAKSGKAISSDIDMRPSDEYPFCRACKYNEDYEYCSYYRRKAGIGDDAVIEEIQRNSNGLPVSVTIVQDGVKKENPLSQDATKGKSIIQLWNEIKPQVAAFMNLKTGKYVRISKDPAGQIARYGKCYGKWSYDGYRYSNESNELYGVTDECWVCTWHK